MSIPNKRSKAKTLFAMALLSTGSLFVTLLVLELLLRVVVGAPLPDTTFSLLRSTSYRIDNNLGWRPNPNVRGVHTQKGYFESTFSTNSLGLRGPEISKEKRPGEQRVLLVGDSFTWGYGVNDNQTFAARLEQLLEGVKVINLGVTAYGLEQEYRYLQSEGLSYNPDLVVINICANDIEDYHPKNGLGSGFPLPPRKALNASDPNSSLPLKTKKFLGEKSALYSFVIGRVNSDRRLLRFLVRIGVKEKLEGYESLDANLRPALRKYPPSLQAGLEQSYETLLMIKELTDSHKIPLLLAMIPGKTQFSRESLAQFISYLDYEEDDFEVDKVDRLLREFASKHGIEILIPLQDFRRASLNNNGRSLYFPLGDPHFTAEGHDLYARSLARWIAKYFHDQKEVS